MPEKNEKLLPAPLSPEVTDALLRLLTQKQGLPVETILLLTWRCGLSRRELATLKFSQIAFSDSVIALGDRRVPLDGTALALLERLKEQGCEYVLLTRNKTAPMAEQSISRLAREALDEAGLPQIKLCDLQADCVLRFMRELGVQRTCRATGIDLRTLQSRYMQCGNSPEECDCAPEISRDELHAVMLAEGETNCGLAMQLCWRLGIKASRLHTLSWDMADFDAGTLDGKPLPPDTLELLRGLFEKNARYSEKLFLGEAAKKPLTRERISRIVKSSLVRHGVDGVALSDLTGCFMSNAPDLREELTALLLQLGCADSRELSARLGLEKKSLAALLSRLRAEGAVVLIGREYYPAEAVVPPQMHSQVILSFVAEHPLCSRAELCQMLGLKKPRQLGSIVKPLLAEGSLLRTPGQKYTLPEPAMSPLSV